jgi:hypothetical protein
MSRCSAVQLRQSKSGSKRACFIYFNAVAERITKRQFLFLVAPFRATYVDGPGRLILM